MSLLTRLIAPVGEEEKIPVHQFMAALAEHRRGSPDMLLADIHAAFNLDAGEQATLATVIQNHNLDGISRELIHDVLMLGEQGIYTLAEVQSRLIDLPSTTDLWSLVIGRSFEIIAAGVRGDCVLSGCAVSAQGSPDMTLAVAKGAVLSNHVLRAVTAGNVTIGAAHSTLPRIDMVVVVDSSGTKQVRAGTAAAKPAAPQLTTNDVAIAFVYIPPGDTAINAGQLQDTRTFRNGPIVVGRLSSAIVRNNSSAIENFLTLTIPNGLFVNPRHLRCRMGGTMLLNSGSPTVSLRIQLNGTTLFADVTGTATADTDRLAWVLDFELTAQADNDQAFNGYYAQSILGAKTAPSSGIGDIAGTAALVNAIAGSAAVDMTTADRNLTVDFQMSVANPANEITMEYATAELI